jgi:hypothetical protein
MALRAKEIDRKGGRVVFLENRPLAIQYRRPPRNALIPGKPKVLRRKAAGNELVNIGETRYCSLTAQEEDYSLNSRGPRYESIKAFSVWGVGP